MNFSLMISALFHIHGKCSAIISSVKIYILHTFIFYRQIIESYIVSAKANLILYSVCPPSDDFKFYQAFF